MTDTRTTTVPTQPTSQPTSQSTQPATSRRGLLARLGGLALGAAPVLFVVGSVTSPPQDSASNLDYVASMARAPYQAALSANFFHYAWVLFAVGVLAAATLPATARGRTLTGVLAALASLTSIQISGLLLSDFYAVRMSEQNGVADAAAVEFDLGTSVGVWLTSGQLAALFVPLLFVGLARARVISWWVVPMPLLFVVAIVVPGLPVVVSAGLGLLAFTPAYLTAARLLRG